MYVAKPLSQLLNSAAAYSANPDGPDSGCLVLQDEDQYLSSGCFGLCKDHILTKLPFPQNKELCFRSWSPAPQGEVNAHVDPVFLIPVIDRPLSSNRYYAIVPYGKHKGKAFTCSTEANRTARGYISYVEPRPLDPRNVYQQFHIVRHDKYYKVKSVASDGFPPSFTQREGWRLHAKTPKRFALNEAKGLDHALRARLPQLDPNQESVEVGKWYCPFMFVKEGRLNLKDQVKRSMYYEMTLEQRWERIFTCRRIDGVDPRKAVKVEAVLEKEEVFVGGVHKAGVMDERNAVEGVVWYTGARAEGEAINVGLRVEILRRMRWEQARGGWIDGEGREVRIKKEEEMSEDGREWREMGCYVLVERFNLKRMDGSVALAYDFKHCHQIRVKWEE